MTRFFIHTRWRAQSHQWDVVDGMVEYRGEITTPREVCERFPSDYPMFEVMRAEVCERIDVDGPRPYSWVEVERFV
jgi:hypothetical protein